MVGIVWRGRKDVKTSKRCLKVKGTYKVLKGLKDVKVERVESNLRVFGV